MAALEKFRRVCFICQTSGYTCREEQADGHSTARGGEETNNVYSHLPVLVQ